MGRGLHVSRQATCGIRSAGGVGSTSADAHHACSWDGMHQSTVRCSHLQACGRRLFAAVQRDAAGGSVEVLSTALMLFTALISTSLTASHFTVHWSGYP